MDRFVTVAVFTLPHELAVVRARLEWEGIRCFAKDENTVSANPLYSHLVGGIKLQVPAEHAERARAILAEGGDAWPEGEGPTEKEKTLPRPPSLPALSPRVQRRIALWVIGLVVLLFVLLG